MTQSAFVLGAYALASFAIISLILCIAMDYRSQLRALSRLKDKGAIPGHEQR